MGFKPVSIDEYVKIHLNSNPLEHEKDLRKKLESTLLDYKDGVKCSCGDDIWVIGSAVVGNSCFTCITGEAYPKDDYEIGQAIRKENRSIREEYIDDIDKLKTAGFFDDDGYEINTDLIKKPPLCIICKNDNNPDEELLCNMTRYDQKDEEEFKCFTYLER